VDPRDIAAGVLLPLGYDVLEVVFKSVGSRRVLTVRIERADEVPISVSDVEQANRALGDELERIDAIPGAYLLEVESPGPDRPLITARHFERFTGLRAKVKASTGNFVGRIEKVEEGAVVFSLEDGNKSLELGSFKATLAEWPETPR
jgi:ribosome maturation factor RimP